MAGWVRIVCAVALLCVGFAHKPPALGAQPLPPLLLAQYALPDGTLPVLCLPGDDGDDGGDAHRHGFGTGCEACRLAADIFLPRPASSSSWLLPRPAGGVLVPRIEAFSRHLFPPSSSPRAPPSGQAA